MIRWAERKILSAFYLEIDGMDLSLKIKSGACLETKFDMEFMNNVIPKRF